MTSLFPDLNILTLPSTRVARRRRRPTAAEIVAFPLDRWSSTVQAVAAGLERREGEARDAYWRATVQSLRRQLSSSRLSDETAIREIRSFRSAVQFAIDFHRFGDAPNGKDGAA